MESTICTRIRHKPTMKLSTWAASCCSLHNMTWSTGRKVHRPCYCQSWLVAGFFLTYTSAL
uniref:ADP-glucose pyrophosphorylase large subunit n=1 Tax=Rhizophora mucronata TaxID=61149 RepID=A0A2P2LH63_RHIMU